MKSAWFSKKRAPFNQAYEEQASGRNSQPIMKVRAAKNVSNPNVCSKVLSKEGLIFLIQMPINS